MAVCRVNEELKSKSAMFEKGSDLFCASHGVGKILDIETQQYYGQDVIFYRIEFIRNNLQMLVPIDNSGGLGIRKLVSTKEVQKVFADILLGSKPRTIKGVWSKRAQEYETKIYSGEMFLIAEVVRDLYSNIRDAVGSYSERNIYEIAFDRIINEVALVLSIAKEESSRRIIEALEKSYSMYVGSSNASDVTAGESDGDFDDDDL